MEPSFGEWVNRINFSDPLPQLSKCRLLLATAPSTISQLKEAAVAELPGKDHEPQFLLACPKRGKLPDFPEKGWAQHLPVGTLDSFPFPLALDHAAHTPSSPLALWWG